MKDQHRLFVACGRECTESQLFSLFSPFGNILSLDMATGRARKPRGFAVVEYQYSESAKTALHQLHGTALKNGYVLKVRPWEDPKVTQQAGKRQAVKTDEVQRKVNPSMATPGKRQKSTTRWADKVVLVDFEQDNAQMKRALSPTLWSIGEKADIAGSVHECKRYRNERINVRTTGNSSTTPSTTRSNADKQIASLLEEESDFLKQSRAVPNALERVKGSSLKNRLFITCNSKYTLQELSAMFGAYGTIETIRMVRCYGKLQTMAYVTYDQASVAIKVVHAMAEAMTSVQPDEKMHVCFATSQESQEKMPSPRRSNRLIDSAVWLIAHCSASNVSNSMISKFFAMLPGMQQIEIASNEKAEYSTPTIAFAKFADELAAAHAIQFYSNCEIDPGSGIRVTLSQWHRDEDVDDVQNRFAHLMRPEEHAKATSAQELDTSLENIDQVAVNSCTDEITKLES